MNKNMQYDASSPSYKASGPVSSTKDRRTPSPIATADDPVPTLASPLTADDKDRATPSPTADIIAKRVPAIASPLTVNSQ